jgi:G patch domain-containing protein 1
MDDEDLADVAEAQQPDSADAFAGLGARADVKKDGLFTDLIHDDETMGKKLLQMMGWREGQGIGPKVRRKARLDGDEAGAEDGEMHLFAPKDSPMISFSQKVDQKGLGYTGEARLSTRKTADTEEDVIDSPANPLALSKVKKKSNPRSGFGVGVLNDTGSDDDDDPYSIGPSISYSRTVTSSKSKKTPKPKRTLQNANPLLASKPVFISSKANKSSSFRRCHDSRLPPPGFVLASKPYSPPTVYPPPTIPPDWKTSKTPSTARASSNLPSTAQAAKDSTLTPSSRASILGETPLPSASVFTYLTPAARARLVSKTQNPNLPAATYAPPPQSTEDSEETTPIPPLPPTLALSALNPSSTAFQPYKSDPAKLARYTTFLRYRANLSQSPPSRPSFLAATEWTAELAEFAHAAQLFRPASGLMAQRFTSSSSSIPPGSHPNNTDPTSPGSEEILLQTRSKKEDPATEAALLGLYGPLTRSTTPWMPLRLLCKRFGVRVPEHVAPAAEEEEKEAGGDLGGGGNNSSSTAPLTAASSSAGAADSKVRGALASREMMEEMMRASGRDLPSLAAEDSKDGNKGKKENGGIVDLGVNEALEKERPGMDVFRAVFGSDSEDE